MPILPVVGRRSFKIRTVVALIYLALAVLGVGMVYPFLMTVTASVSGPMDYERYAPVPKSLWSRDERFVGELSAFFPDTMRNGMQLFSLSFSGVPETWTTWKGVGDDEEGIVKFAEAYLRQSSDAGRYSQLRRAAADYDAFANAYPLSECICTFDDQLVGSFFRDRYRELARRSGSQGNLDESALKLMSADWGIPLDSFYAFQMDREYQAPWDQAGFLHPVDGRGKTFDWLWQAYRDREFLPAAVKAKWTRFSDAPFPTTERERSRHRAQWAKFTGAVDPMCETRPFPMKSAWLRSLGSDDVRVKLGVGGGGPLTLEEYNRAFGTFYRRLADTPFPVASDAPPKMRARWEDYVRLDYPRRMIEVRVTPLLESAFRKFVRDRCHGNLDRLNTLVDGHFTSWDAVAFPARVPTRNDAEAGLWMQFTNKLPFDALIPHSAEADYQAYLLQLYGDLDAVDRAYGWSLNRVEQAEMPVDAAYLVTFVENERPMYVSSLTRNYRIVLDYLFHRERAVWNTFVLIACSLLAVLTVNPLAAYALSRFQLKQTAAVILFLLATMAFPVAVSMIPGFLLMRDLHLLNTYGALILPGLANGFSIFLLKGFFDSLPPELYEAATLDGAREWQIFMRITRPLSTPILAVIALNCFMATYAAWEWAFVVCQKESMWTVSVWLYKFTVDWAGAPWLVMASFVIASIPVFLVFLLCQNIILRGIILPQMK